MTITRDDVLAWLNAYAAALAENKDYLTQLDSDIGDADHGANMDRGFKAVKAKLESNPGSDIGAILKTVGMTLVSTVGGAGGPLYGTLFLQAGMATAGKNELTPADVVAMFDAGLKGVVMRGKAVLEDKTMVDALTPAVEKLRTVVDGGGDLDDALRQAA
jgi:dihydroxyacetone kinase-like protein